jgi:hypothetical protein
VEFLASYPNPKLQDHPLSAVRDCLFGIFANELHNDEVHSLYSSPNIVRVIKSRRMKWVGHVARMGEGRGVYRVLVGMPEGK